MADIGSWMSANMLMPKQEMTELLSSGTLYCCQYRVSADLSGYLQKSDAFMGERLFLECYPAAVGR